MADPKTVATVAPQHVFTNVARVRHTGSEFYLEFGQQSLDQPGVAGVVSFLVMTPQHAKLLLVALQGNIGKFEAANGEIALPPRPEKGTIQ